jgi:rfaE bifunctional protein kinase chain/domain
MVVDLFQEFQSKRILVLGDVMLDSYLIGDVTRISPEAPVPVVNLVKKEDRLGGAANVALNIVALGAEAILCSVIGEDWEAKQLMSLVRTQSISFEGIVQSTDRKTTVKTRILGHNQQLLRIDSEHVHPISEEEECALIQRVSSLLKTGIDAIIFQDYNKGVLTPRVIQQVIALALKFNVPTTVDPKKDNFFEYKGVTLFKPNLKELKEGLNIAFDIVDKEAFELAVAMLEERIENKITFITLSEHGVFIKSHENKSYIPAHVRNIADVSGAGDTVISVATLCLTVGLAIEKIAAYANLAGGMVCEKSGVVSIEKEQLHAEIVRLDKQLN